jgi:hypothetical protein
MHKKLDTQELDIPMDDIECWERYPKHRWVYDLSRLLDAQSIGWSPFETSTLKSIVKNMHFDSLNNTVYSTSYIFINEPQGMRIVSEVYIIRGEIKLIRYIDKQTQTEIQDSTGNIELRINAFVSMHFQKFTGIITIDLVGNDMMSVRLRPYSELDINANIDIIRLTKKIYKRKDVTSYASNSSDSVILQARCTIA